MNTNKGSIVKQSGNDVEGCRFEKVLVQPKVRVFMQHSLNLFLQFDNAEKLNSSHLLGAAERNFSAKILRRVANYCACS